MKMLTLSAMSLSLLVGCIPVPVIDDHHHGAARPPRAQVEQPSTHHGEPQRPPRPVISNPQVYSYPGHARPVVCTGNECVVS